MLQTIEPDYYINIGIKDDEVIEVDWSDWHNSLEGKKILFKPAKHIIKLLKKAIKVIK